MKNIDDLNIEKEVLPLFDFTVNHFAREQLYTLFHQPLSSVNDILARQAIIKGFIKNETVLANYSYSKPGFYEVHSFLHAPNIGSYTSMFKVSFGFSKKDIKRIQSAMVQFVTLFREIEVYYIKKIDIGFFPVEYKTELVKLHDFLASFNLNRYKEQIKEDRFGTRHVAELATIIAKKQATGEIKSFFNRFAMFEAFISISKAVLKHGFCFPAFVKHGLELEGVYHPVLINPVKNDFSGNRNVVLLTGPNMSGKSTFLKAIGICVSLAHLGMAVPATKAQTPFYDLITVSINHHDDILSGYSHFMMEIIRLKEVVIRATKGMNCFAIFDELFKGTNIEDALHITTTTVSGLVQFQTSSFIISTHLHQMRDVQPVAGGEVDTCHIDCSINEGVPVFNYRVKPGWSDLKIGQLLFAKEGLNDLLNVKAR